MMLGIGHLRGHETNRLEALVNEIKRIGGEARELSDGLEIVPVYSLFPAVCFFLPFTIARRALWFPINYGNSRAS